MTVLDHAGLFIAAAILAAGMVCAGDAARPGRYAFVGATPKGIVIFDTVTGTVAVGPPPVALQPEE